MELPYFEQVKRDLIEKFSKEKTYLGSFIKDEITKVSFKPNQRSENIPTYIKKGDVFISQEGAKNRPCVVLRILKDRTIIYTTLTSSDNIHCLSESSSRFFKEGCFCKTLSVCTEQYALDNFVGVYDNMKAVNNAIKELKNYIINNL